MTVPELRSVAAKTGLDKDLKLVEKYSDGRENYEIQRTFKCEFGYNKKLFALKNLVHTEEDFYELARELRAERGNSQVTSAGLPMWSIKKGLFLSLEEQRLL